MKNKIVPIIMGLVGIACVVLLGMSAWKWWDGKEESNRVKRGYSACKKKTETALKAPGSAKWAKWSDVTVVKEDGDKHLSYSYHVDSQNGFGAMMRTRWLCHAKRSGDGWKVTKLQMTGGK